MRRAPCLAAAFAVLIAFFSASFAVRAQPAERAVDSASADALFRRAKQLMDEEKLEEACTAFDSSFDLEPAIGTALNAANCYEQIGRTATARARWSVAVELSRKKNDPRGSFAQERFDALSKVVPWLTIRVENAGKVRGVSVRKGDVTLSAGAYGSELPTDPGVVSVLVLQGDDVLYETAIKLAPSEHREVSLDLEKIYKSAPSVRKKLGESKVELGGAGGGPVVTYWNGQRVGGLVTGIGGVIAMGIGFGFGGATLAEKSTIEEACITTRGDTSYCTAAGRSAAASAELNGHLAEGFIIGGAVITAVGLTLFLAAPTGSENLDERAERSPTFALDVYGGLDQAGVAAKGTF